MLDAALIARYAPGGDLYQTYAAQYGDAVAQSIYTAAQGDDARANITTIITQAKYGPALNTSTTEIFEQDVAQEVQNAENSVAGAVNNQIGNLVAEFFGNPWILTAVSAFVFFKYFDGMNVLKGLVKK